MNGQEEPAVTESSGNVYADVGFPEAEIMIAKAELVEQIADIIEANGWMQTEAARHVGLSQPKISDLLRGKFRGFTLERLMRILTQLQRDISICSAPAPAAQRIGRISVCHGEQMAAAGDGKPKKLTFS